MLPGGPLASFTRSRYSDASTGAIGPTSTILLPPDDDPPAAPSVNSQALPLDWAARLIGPAAAWAWASVAKLSTRQKSGPAGSFSTFFSASGLMTSVPVPATPMPPDCAMAGGAASPASANSATATVRNTMLHVTIVVRQSVMMYLPSPRAGRLSAGQRAAPMPLPL